MTLCCISEYLLKAIYIHHLWNLFKNNLVDPYHQCWFILFLFNYYIYMLKCNYSFLNYNSWPIIGLQNQFNDLRSLFKKFYRINYTTIGQGSGKERKYQKAVPEVCTNDVPWKVLFWLNTHTHISPPKNYMPKRLELRHS